MRFLATLLVGVVVMFVALGTVLNEALNAAPPIAVVLPTITIPLPTSAVPVPTVLPTLPPAGGAESIIEIARSWLNPPVPYLWGGCTRRGVDCSCAVRNWWAVLGISMPRTTSEQIRWATPITREQIQPGDLLFFNNTCTNCGPNPTHVGMVLDAQRGLMIHAGDPVQISRWDSLQFAGAGRVHP